MSVFSLEDFTETMERAGIECGEVAGVRAAWGTCGSDNEWAGGFLLEMRDGRWAYVTGWCDTTGWGCQDGHVTTWYETRPPIESLDQFWVAEMIDVYNTEFPWAIEPADLNDWIKT